MLMMLAFLIDQVQQLCCKVYQQARKHVGTLPRLFEKIQNRIDIAAWDSWHHLLTFLDHNNYIDINITNKIQLLPVFIELTKSF